ncbi:MAG: aliphatic sulfonate ABC transporter substrate-binding protein [Lachnospirales bacterium]
MKKLISLLMSVVMAFSLSACGGGETETASSENGLTKVTLGMVPWPAFEIFYLADEKGIFEKNGLDVDIQEFSSTTDNSSAFVGGQLDFCTYASAESIAPYAEGAGFKVVLLADKSNGCEGLVATSDIKTVADLKGKTVATQYCSVDHLLLLTLLQENGMTIDDINMVDMSIEAAGNAFIAGQCDAACIWDPYFSQAKAKGGNVLYSTSDNPDIISDVLAASGDMIENHPDVVEAMVKSFYEAADYWRENGDESSEFMAEKLGVSKEEFNAQISGLIIPDAKMALESFTPADNYTYWGYTQNTVEKFMNEMGVLDTDADCGEMIDSSFVEKLASE